MNHWSAIGRTTDDVEIRYTQEQMAIGNFTLAVDDGYGERKTTSFFRCTVFGKTAEAMSKYAPKGTKIAVEGRPKQDNWKDKNGNNRSAIIFVINSWEFAQSRETPQGQPKQETADDGFMAVPEGIEEELPFI